MKLATAVQMRELDRLATEEDRIPSIDLMEQAADGIVQTALELLPRRPGKCRAAVLCGAGNNGGDGISAARKLFLKGVHVRAFLVGSYEKLTQDALREEPCADRRDFRCGPFPGNLTGIRFCRGNPFDQSLPGHCDLR